MPHIDSLLLSRIYGLTMITPEPISALQAHANAISSAVNNQDLPEILRLVDSSTLLSINLFRQSFDSVGPCQLRAHTPLAAPDSADHANALRTAVSLEPGPLRTLIIEILLHKRANFRVPDDHGCSVMDVAELQEDQELIQLFRSWKTGGATAGESSQHRSRSQSPLAPVADFFARALSQPRRP